MTKSGILLKIGEFMTKSAMFKYPIMMISIVLGLILIECSLDIDFSEITDRITKIGPQGIELDHETRKHTSVAVSELERGLKELTARMEALEKKADTVQVLRSPKLVSAEFDEVSDAVSQLSMSQSKSTKTVLVGRKGYIFIGIHNSTDGKWKRAILHHQYSNKPVTSAPNQLPVGGGFLVGTNMVLRDGLPPNDNQYFRSIKNIGVIPRGTLVALLDQPEGIDRGFAVEYWAPVEVSE